MKIHAKNVSFLNIDFLGFGLDLGGSWASKNRQKSPSARNPSRKDQAPRGGAAVLSSRRSSIESRNFEDVSRHASTYDDVIRSIY